MSTTIKPLSRRRVLTGAAAVAGAGAVAMSGCAPDGYDGAGMRAVRVRRIPTDPDDVLWRNASETIVALGPQDIALPMKQQPTVTEISVKSLHDGERIAFLLQWTDPDTSDLTVRVDDFRDACAVMFLPGGSDEALRPMGSTTTAATLLHWKADWQRDVDQGRQDVATVYPNRTIDVYPPLWNVAPKDVDMTSYEAAGATEWLPGMHVGNPISAPLRERPVEKAIAYGFSTTTTAEHQDADGRGARHGNGWQVIVTKPLAASDEGETTLRPGDTVSCAFAVWSGSEHDAGSRKAPSRTLHTLSIGA